MQIKPGDIYWLTTKSDIAHPHVVIEVSGDQVTVCSITTNMNKLNFPGNILLEEGEGGLEKQSIVEVSKQDVVNESDLGEYVGILNSKRVDEIKTGVSFIHKSFY